MLLHISQREIISKEKNFIEQSRVTLLSRRNQTHNVHKFHFEMPHQMYYYYFDTSKEKNAKIEDVGLTEDLKSTEKKMVTKFS